MCLDTRYDRATEKKMIAKLPDEFVVYKVARQEGVLFKSCFTNVCWGCNIDYWFEAGENCAKETAKNATATSDSKADYKCGFHSFKTKRGAYRFRRRRGFSETGRTVVKAKIKREWVTAIGTQYGCQCIVSKKIIMPSPSDKKAIVA